MDTEDIISAFNMKNFYLDDKNYYEERIKELQEQLDMTNGVLEVINRVSCIYNNKPIGESNNYPDTYSCALIQDFPRINKWANLYLNQHNKRTYGVYVKLDQAESWLGKDIKSYEEAKRLCLEFVSRDCSPSEFKYDYERQKI